MHRNSRLRTLPAILVSLALLAGLGGIPVEAGSLAPAPRVVTERDRDFLERSGAQTLEELLDTGIVRYFYTGGQPLPVLVNGRPYTTTAGDLDTLPLSAIERLELLSGDSLGTMGGGAQRGAINVVLREDLDGFETKGLTRMPSRDGGDGWQGSAFWGGDFGEGRITVGVDVLGREEIASLSREFSRSSWRQGGAFNEAKNISVGGNTVYIQKGDGSGYRTVSLGSCDPSDGYTGPLANPPGIRNGDRGCGFAYGDIAWNSDRFEQRTAIVNLDHPLGEKAALHLDANLGEGESAFRYAPSVGTLPFTPTQDLLDAINDAAGSRIADASDHFVAAHRFIGHGNRDWLREYGEHDASVGIDGHLAEGLGYDARVDAYWLDGSVSGDTFVHIGTASEEVEAGRYDLVNPFSTDPDHLEAIRKSSLREEVDFGQEYLGTRLALEGNAFAIGGRDAAWTAGVDAGRLKTHSILRFRDGDGATHKVTQVLGSGGVSYAGERRSAGAFAEVEVPVGEALEFRAAGRADELDDVGEMRSWNLAAEYRLLDIVALRGSWSTGQRPPSMRALHSTEHQDHPYIECDPGSPPQPCAQPNPRQVTRVTEGNPELDPSDTERLAFGAEFRDSGRFVSAEWYRLSRSGLVGQNSADYAMHNLGACTGSVTSNCIERTAGHITIYDSFANIVETEISGVTTRFGGNLRTDWGEVGVSGAWRHVIDADLHIAGKEDRYAISRNMARVRFSVRHGGLSAIWTVNYRDEFKNRRGTGSFSSWTGHDVVLDWKDPLGLEGMRLAAGAFNVTDAGLTVDTANPSAVDGPVAASWGRTLFMTLNVRF